MKFLRRVNRTPIGVGFAVASMLLATAACGSEAEGDGSSSDDTLLIGTDATYAPYEYKDGKEHVGLELDLARAIGKVIGKDIKFVDVKYTVAEGALNSGRFDVAMAGSRDTPERRKKFYVIDELRPLTGLIVPSGNPDKLGKLSTLCGRKISTFPSAGALQPLKAASADCGDNPIDIMALADANGPYAAVQSGRAEAYYGDYLQATVQVKEMSGVEAVEVPDGVKDLLGFMVKRDNMKLAQQMACGLQKVVDSGDAGKIFDKYGVPESAMLEEITINAGDIPLDC